MPLISCENVSLAYEGKTIVSELTFSVERGDYLCIVGENGSGKSTLMKALLGLKTPAEGRIILGDGIRRARIGYLPQQTDLQKDFPASVSEIVLSGCLSGMGLRPFFGKKEKDTAKRTMAELGITDLANRSYRELSGGQQQRVLLARALCAARELLILDEPVAGLDPKITADMYELIENLNKSGVTVIMVSHDIKQAVNYASKILHISSTPLFFGKTADYLNSEAGRKFL